MKKLIIALALLAVAIIAINLNSTVAQLSDDHLGRLHELANVTTTPIPTNDNDIEVWIIETKTALEAYYPTKVKAIIEDNVSITFTLGFNETEVSNNIFEVSYLKSGLNFKPKELSNQYNIVMGPSKIIETRGYFSVPTVILNRTLIDDYDKLEYTNIIHSLIDTSTDAVKVETILHDQIADELEVILKEHTADMLDDHKVELKFFEQQVPRYRIGFVLNDKNEWQVTMILKEVEHYLYIEGRISSFSEPAIPFSTQVTLFKIVSDNEYHSNQERLFNITYQNYLNDTIEIGESIK